jgi:hypothetical protein
MLVTAACIREGDELAVASYGAHPDRMPDNAFPKHFVKAQGTRRGRTPAEQ